MKQKLKDSKLFKAIFSGLMILIGLEFGLRLMGYVPYQPPGLSKVKFYQVDDKKGWVPNPGTYHHAINVWGDSMGIVVNKRRERITKPLSSKENSEEILLIGGSFTLGFGLDDDQTFAWKLQEKFPLVDFRNLGVGGYGTYQSLLVLEEQLKSGEKPKAVIYGFINHHLVRNVSDSDWLTLLSINAERSDMELILPFVSLGENETLLPGKTPKIVQTPFANYLAISFMTQRVINKFLGRKRVRDSKGVLELLLIEMQQVCNENDVPFYISILACDGPLMSLITPFFAKEGIAYIDCNVPLNEENTFRDDGHPKEEVNTEWSKRIGKRLIQDKILTKYGRSE